MGANYREAYRARSKAEFIAKAGECLKEIEETGYWLELLVDSGIVSEERLASLTNECSELTAIFVALQFGRRRATNRVRKKEKRRRKKGKREKKKEERRRRKEEGGRRKENERRLKQ